MDAATATIVCAGIAGVTAIITSIITTRRQTSKSSKELEEYKAEQARLAKERFCDPKEHYIFAKLTHYMTTFIPSIQAAPGISPLKARMFRRFMQIRFSTFYDELHRWVHDTSPIKLTEVSQYVCQTIQQADALALADGIPSEFIDSFLNENKHMVSALLDHFERIMASTAMDANCKELALLDAVLYSINLSVLDAEKTLKRMNGTLDAILIKRFHEEGD